MLSRLIVAVCFTAMLCAPLSASEAQRARMRADKAKRNTLNLESASLTPSPSCACSSDLNADQTKLLTDSGGWEYTKLSDNTGVPTQHVCFDGSPHPSECSGTLTLVDDGTFVQQVVISGTAVDRHGTWKLDGDQLAFFDEFGTQDGPYTVEIDAVKKTMVLSMPQIRMELTLESEYRKSKKK